VAKRREKGKDKMLDQYNLKLELKYYGFIERTRN
jgi:hypothetical protein